MRRKSVAAFFCALLLHPFLPTASADNLTLTTGGRVSIELITSEAAFRNTLSVIAPGVAIALSGCALEPAGGLGGVHVLSEKTSQRGCRVELDADPATAGIQPFAAATVFEFGFCAQTDADPTCEFTWSSDPADNSDGDNHVTTTPINPVEFPGRIFRLSWEDQENLGDADFNDLIVVVRVEIDSDGDGLWDDWEQFGVDSDGNGIVDLNLPALGANPQRKDLFVEIDWMDCSVAGSDCAAGDTHSHQPAAAAIAAVVNAFANANVTNPGVSPPGINLHVELSNAVAHQNTLIIPNACFSGAAGTGFDAIKSDPANFGPANPRRFTHHYNLWTHRQTATTTSSGCAELPGNDFQVSLGAWNYFCVGGTNANQFCLSNANCPGAGATCQPGGDMDGDGVADQDVGTIQQQAGTLMHEFGHNLNLGHGGGDWTNNKPNYLSVMNYTFQVGGIPPTDPDVGGPLVARIDYSQSALPTLVESNLSEPAGIADGADNTFFTCPGSTNLNGNGAGTGAINWNCDPDSTDTPLSTDLNGDANVDCVREGANGVLNTATAGDDVVTGSGLRIREGANRQCDTTATGDDVQWRPLGPLTGYWDWGNIKYDFQNAGDFDDGVHTPQVVQLQELTYELFSTNMQADVAVAIGAAPDPVVTGSDIAYTITVTNLRPTAALDVVVTDNLPASTTFVSCGSTAGGVCGGSGNSRTVSFDAIPGGGSAVITLEATVDCPTPDGTVISNTVTVAAQTDSNPDNNEATAVVTASNPPPALSDVSIDQTVLWPPNHKMADLVVTYTVTDNCGPVALALGASSSEPINGLGDGDTAPDWHILDANHVRLRAERAGRGSGRTYTVTVTATDSAGASSSESLAVFVPHSRR